MKKVFGLLSIVVLLALSGCKKIEIHPEPKFELIGNKDINIDAGSAFSLSIEDVLAQELGTNKDLSSSVSILGEVDIHTPGKYDVVYVLEYGGERYEIKRSITVNPYKSSDLELVLNGSSSMKVLYLGTFIDPYVVVTNLKTGENLTNLVEVEGSVDTTKEGLYTLVYKINYRGVVKTKTRDVQVLEEPGLRLTVNNNTASHNTYVLGDEYIEHGVHIVDLFNGNMISASEIDIKGNFNTEIPGTYTIRYSVSVRDREYVIERTVEVVELINNVVIKLTSSNEWLDVYSIRYDIADKNKRPDTLHVHVLLEDNIDMIYEVNGNTFELPLNARIIRLIYSYKNNNYKYEV